MSFPAFTGSGVSTLVTDRSADAWTVVVAVALSFPGLPSPVVDVTEAVLESTVRSATEASTATVSVKTALPTAKEGFEHVTVAPGEGHVQPATGDSETKVVPAGSVSL